MAKDFDGAFAALRGAMLEAASGMTVARDEPGYLELRTPTLDAKTGQPGWFGTVKIGRAYVACHLVPLYDHPEVIEGCSEALAKRRQGKTCFNFKAPEPELVAELAGVARRVAERVG